MSAQAMNYNEWLVGQRTEERPAADTLQLVEAMSSGLVPIFWFCPVSEKESKKSDTVRCSHKVWWRKKV